MQEGADLGPANWALVCLHSDDLAAVDTEAHMAARQHDRVLGGGVADDALLLTLVSQVGGAVIDPVNIIQVHNLIIIQQLLFLVFEPERIAMRGSLSGIFRLVHGRAARCRGVLLKVSISELAILLPSASIILRVNSLDLYHDRAEVALRSEQVEIGGNQRWLQLIDINNEDLARELLIQSRAESESAGCRHLWVTVEIQWNIASIPALHRAQVDRDHTFVIRVELHLERVLVGLVWQLDLYHSEKRISTGENRISFLLIAATYKFYGLFLDIALVLYRVHLLLVLGGSGRRHLLAARSTITGAPTSCSSVLFKVVHLSSPLGISFWLIGSAGCCSLWLLVPH